MQSDNRFFSDFSRVASGAFGAVSGLREEVEALFRQRVERWLAEFDVASREEFDAVRDMAAKARAQQEDILIRLGAIEERLARLEAQAADGRPGAVGPGPAPKAPRRRAPAKPRSE